MAYNPNKQTKLYYNISEVAEMMGITETALRYWEKEFKNIHPQKTARGVRQYTKEDIEQVRIVYHLVKEKGMTLDGARQTIKNGGKEQITPKTEAIDRLLLIKQELQALRQELGELV